MEPTIQAVPTGRQEKLNNMKTVVISDFGGPEVLEIQDRPVPVAVADQVLVRVRASALNRADLLQRRGRYPAPPGSPQDIPGLEFAGEVAQIGPDVSQWRVGQRVFGIVGGGAHAEFLLAHERALAEIPENLSWNEAAAVPEAFITVYDALWLQAELKACERVLIPAVGSGVGLAAVQLTRARNATPYGTARTQEKLLRAKECGLDHGAVVTQASELPVQVERWLGNDKAKFDVVLELVGGDYVATDIEVLGLKGRLILVGIMAGASVDLKLHSILSKRLKIIGTMLRARPLEEKIAVTQSFAKEVVPLFAAGVLKPVVDSVFPMHRVREAHERMESNANFGKIVIAME